MRPYSACLHAATFKALNKEFVKKMQIYEILMGDHTYYHQQTYDIESEIKEQQCKVMTGNYC